MVQLMQGYRTYVSIILSLLGSFGFFEKTGLVKEEVADTIDAIMVAVFSATALYFNWKNHQKMK
jgi:hypothetical protein